MKRLLIGLLLSLAPSLGMAEANCAKFSIAATLRSHTFGGQTVTFQNARMQDPVSVFTTSLRAMYDDINNIPRFACVGLRLTPNDLTYVQTFGELVSVVAWGLRQTQVQAAHSK